MYMYSSFLKRKIKVSGCLHNSGCLPGTYFEARNFIFGLDTSRVSFKPQKLLKSRQLWQSILPNAFPFCGWPNHLTSDIKKSEKMIPFRNQSLHCSKISLEFCIVQKKKTTENF